MPAPQPAAKGPVGIQLILGAAGFGVLAILHIVALVSEPEKRVYEPAGIGTLLIAFLTAAVCGIAAIGWGGLKSTGSMLAMIGGFALSAAALFEAAVSFVEPHSKFIVGMALAFSAFLGFIGTASHAVGGIGLSKRIGPVGFAVTGLFGIATLLSVHSIYCGLTLAVMDFEDISWVSKGEATARNVFWLLGSLAAAGLLVLAKIKSSGPSPMAGGPAPAPMAPHGMAI